MEQYGIADVFNAGLNSVNAGLNAYTQLAEKKSKQDLFVMQEKLSSDINDFLLDLEQNNDYENWNYKVDQFLEQKKNLLAQKPGKGEINPYYCSNSFEAQQAQNLLTSQYNNLKNKVNFIALGKMQQDQLTRSFEAKKIIDNNKGYTLAERLGKKAALDEDNFVNGVIDYDKYIQFRKNDTVEGILKEISDVFDTRMDQGMSLAEIKKEINSRYGDTVTISVLDGSTSKESLEEGNATYMDSIVDITSEKNKLMKLKTDEYNANLNAMYKQNASKLATVVTQMRSTADPMERLKIAIRGQNMIDNFGDKLAENDKLQYSAIFDIFKEFTTIEAKNAKDSEKKKEDYLKDWIKTNPDVFAQKFFDGSLSPLADPRENVDSLYKANEMFENAFMDVLNDLYDDETDKTAAKDKYYSVIGSFMESTLNKLMFDTKNNPAYKPVQEKLENLKKMFEKDTKGEFPPDAYAGIVSFCMDYIASNDTSFVKPDDIITALDKATELYRGNKIDSLMLNKKGQLKNKADDPKSLAKALAELGQTDNDVIFTDINGADQWLNNDYKKALEADSGVVKSAMKAVADYLKIDPKDGSMDFDYLSTKMTRCLFRLSKQAEKSLLYSRLIKTVKLLITRMLL